MILSSFSGRPVFGRFWPAFGLCWPAFGLCWPALAGIWPVLAGVWPVLASIDFVGVAVGCSAWPEIRAKNTVWSPGRWPWLPSRGKFGSGFEREGACDVVGVEARFSIL
jgi:hypothetical protein